MRARGAWRPVSRVSWVRVGGHCRLGGPDRLVSWGHRVASGCCVQPLGFGVTGRARRGPAWSSPLWHSALSERIVRCPIPLRGAEICASERPGARWAPGEPCSWWTLAQVTECRL